MNIQKRLLEAINRGLKMGLELDDTPNEGPIFKKAEEHRAENIIDVYTNTLKGQFAKNKFDNRTLIYLKECPNFRWKPKSRGEFLLTIELLMELTHTNDPDLNFVDVSNLTNMSLLFYNKSYRIGVESTISKFNGDISKWDVSHVTNMSLMFYLSDFNGNISNWDVSNVKDMGCMFAYSKFNKDINVWNVSGVTDMHLMFSESDFNQPIGNWNTSNVTDMCYMFEASSFNLDISKWNTSSVTNMSYMFKNNKAFNQPIGNWDTSNVTNMEQMFYCSSFNQDISNWNVSKVEYMGSMFAGYAANDWNSTPEFINPFNQDISNWNVHIVKYMNNMFAYSNFAGDLSNWDMKSATDFKCIFDHNKPQVTIIDPVKNHIKYVKDVYNNPNDSYTLDKFKDMFKGWKPSNKPQWYKDMYAYVKEFRAKAKAERQSQSEDSLEILKDYPQIQQYYDVAINNNGNLKFDNPKTKVSIVEQTKEESDKKYRVYLNSTYRFSRKNQEHYIKEVINFESAFKHRASPYKTFYGPTVKSCLDWMMTIPAFNMFWVTYKKER